MGLAMEAATGIYWQEVDMWGAGTDCDDIVQFYKDVAWYWPDLMYDELVYVATAVEGLYASVKIIAPTHIAHYETTFGLTLTDDEYRLLVTQGLDVLNSTQAELGEGVFANTPPVAGPDSYEMAAGEILMVEADDGLLANDTDAEGHWISPAAFEWPSHGRLLPAGDGAFTYVHDGGDATTDSFSYLATDGMSDSERVTVTITIDQPPPVDSVALVAGGPIFQMRDTAGGAVDINPYYYGNPDDHALMGDWDCDGERTPGMYRRSDGLVYLRNSNDTGVADRQFFLGNPGDFPLAGDFNGDGCDTVSAYRPSEARFYISNVLASDNTGIVADYSFLFGNAGDKPFVGDFDGDGTDTVGLHRETTGRVYFRNTNDTGIAHADFIFGDPGDMLVAGDWDGNGVDTVAVYRTSTGKLYFKMANTQGIADLATYVGKGFSGIGRF